MTEEDVRRFAHAAPSPPTTCLRCGRHTSFTYGGWCEDCAIQYDIGDDEDDDTLDDSDLEDYEEES